MPEQNENKNYILIPVNEPHYYIGDEQPKRDEKFSGSIELTITAKSDIHIASGFIEKDRAGLYKTAYTVNGKAVIPGSSLKGCVRHIATIVSDGCLIDLAKEKNKDKNIELRYGYDNIKCNSKKRCIICDMFGMKGRKSKITFTDMMSDNAEYKTVTLPKRHSASSKNGVFSKPYHDDGVVRGYKVYKDAKIKTSADGERTQVVSAGAEFKGTVFFNKLTPDELQLLCFVLGLSEEINLKIGAHKNNGMGVIAVKGKLHGVLSPSGKEAGACATAKAYYNRKDSSKPEKHGEKFIKNINKLKEVYKQ